MIVGMDKVTLNGKVYERSAAVAKRHGYTSDYMGQLSRSGKVDAELVGRSWYVHSPSVEAYKQGIEDPEVCDENESQSDDTTHTTVQTDDKESYSVPVHRAKASPETTRDAAKEGKTTSGADEKSFSINLSRASENPSAATKTSPTTATGEVSRPDSVLATASIARPHERYARWRQVAYEPDDTELVPGVRKGQPDPKTDEDSEEPKTAHNDQSAQSIRVHSTSDQYSIVNSGLPSVRLRGKVSITANEDGPDSGDYTEAHTAVQQRIRQYNEQKRQQTTPSSTNTKVVPTPEPAPVATEPEGVSETSTLSRTRYLWLVLIILLAIVASVLLLSLVRVTTYDGVNEVFVTNISFQPFPTLWHELRDLILN